MSRWMWMLLVCTLLRLDGVRVFAQTPKETPRWVDIASRWEERAAKMPAILAHYEEHTFQAAGTGYGNNRSTLRDGVPIQPKDLNLETDVTFLGDRERWRWETKGDVWEGLFEAVISRERINVFDGERRFAYEYVDGEPSIERRPGWIGDDNSGCFWSQMPQLIPWMMLYRPLRSRCGVLASDVWVPYGATAMISNDDGTESLVYLEFRSDKYPGHSIKLTIDPQRDFTVRRYVSGVTSVEIEYKEYPPYGWLPSRWKRIMMKDDYSGVARETTVNVRSLKPNVSIDDSDFDVEFPPGTIVTDTSSEGDSHTTFYVQEDGSRRKITRDEWIAGLDYSKLKGSPSGSLTEGLNRRSSNERPSRLWLIYVNVAILGLVMALLFLKRRKVAK